MPTGFKVDCVSSWSCLYVGEETSRGGQREGGGGGHNLPRHCGVGHVGARGGARGVITF